jgi:hypothetical protein
LTAAPRRRNITGAGRGRQHMSHQESKKIARDVLAGLLAKHPPGLVVMILRELKTILRATKDLTIYAKTEGKQTHENQNTPHP